MVAEPVAGACHERSVKRAPDRHREHSLGAQLLRNRAELGQRLGSSRDDHLARSIEIRYPRVAVDAPACHLDGFVVETEDRDHRPRRELRSLLHRGAALLDQAQPVLEIERTCSNEGCVLAKTVTGRSRRLDTYPLGCVEHDEALHERGDLGVVGTGQSFLVGFEEEMGQIPPCDLRGEGDELERRMVNPGGAHARSL